MNSDRTSSQAMQDEIILLKEKIDYLENGNRKLHASCETSNQNLQDKLETCENQNGAIFGLQSNNQVCERKLKGIVQLFFYCLETLPIMLTF